MSASRDPWLAANLSWSFAGLGQLYAGRRRAGFVLLGFEVFFWIVLIVGVFSARISTEIYVATLVAQYILWIGAAALAHRAVPADPTNPPPRENPWKALFLTRFIPGLGQMTSAHVVRGILLLILAVGVLAWPSTERIPYAGYLGLTLVRGLALADAFHSLRRGNRASGGATVLALTLVLIGSQTYVGARLIQRFGVEVFRIPSSSMEPTLLGDVSDYHSKAGCPFEFEHVSPSGDRIVVSKLPYTFGSVRRFDLAVIKFPLNQSKNFVKRVVGLPDEELQIHRGDLYVRPKGEPRYRIARKPLEVQDRIWIRTHGDFDLAADIATLERNWKLELTEVSNRSDGGVLWPTQRKMGWIRLLRTIDDSSGNPVRDLRVSFDVIAPGESDEVQVRVKTGHGAFDLKLFTLSKGELRLRRAGKDVASVPLPTLPRNQWCRLDLLIFDGQAIVRRDSDVIGQFAMIEFLEDDQWAEESAQEVSVGARGSGLGIRRLLVGRDIHYLGRIGREHGLKEDEPVAIPAGQYLMFGDNVSNAHDSRAWVKRTFVLKDGRKIVCESQQVMDRYSAFTRRLQDKLKLQEPLRYAIDGDQEGNEVAIPEAQFDHEEESVPFRFVDRKFFVGRVLKIWWPLDRQRPVR